MFTEEKDDMNFDHDSNNVDCDCFGCLALIEKKPKGKTMDVVFNQNQGNNN